MRLDEKVYACAPDADSHENLFDLFEVVIDLQNGETALVGERSCERGRDAMAAIWSHGISRLICLFVRSHSFLRCGCPGSGGLGAVAGGVGCLGETAHDAEELC
jgi:hypothetical protein